MWTLLVVLEWSAPHLTASTPDGSNPRIGSAGGHPGTKKISRSAEAPASTRAIPVWNFVAAAVSTEASIARVIRLTGQRFVQRSTKTRFDVKLVPRGIRSYNRDSFLADLKVLEF